MEGKKEEEEKEEKKSNFYLEAPSETRAKKTITKKKFIRISQKKFIRIFQISSNDFFKKTDKKTITKKKQDKKHSTGTLYCAQIQA